MTQRRQDTCQGKEWGLIQGAAWGPGGLYSTLGEVGMIIEWLKAGQQVPRVWEKGVI